jgi:hypothetical protein
MHAAMPADMPVPQQAKSGACCRPADQLVIMITTWVLLLLLAAYRWVGGRRTL